MGLSRSRGRTPWLAALVHDLGLLLVDGQIVRGEDPNEVVHRVPQLAGIGIARERG